MVFSSVAQAFNHYRTMSVADMEKRAAEINTLIDTDPNANIEALNIELRGIKEAKENAELRGSNEQMNVITGMNIKKAAISGDVIDTQEYRSAFFKTMLGQALTSDEAAAFDAARGEMEKRSDAFNTSTNAAAVLPTETLNEVVKKARTIGGLISECRAFNMPTKIAIPVGTPATKAAWHTEGAAVETDKAVVAAVSFDGYEIMKIFSMSAKVKRMSVAAFEAYLIDELTACVMECIADALVNGTGEGEGTGVNTGITWVSGTNYVEVAHSAAVTYADVVKTVAALKRGYAAGAKWVMNNATLYNCFYGLTDSTVRPIFIADPKSESIGKILGFEVIVDDNMPANTAILGNFAQYMAYNMPEGIVIETSRDSGFRKGLIDYRALAIADCKPIVSEAFVKLAIAAQ